MTIAIKSMFCNGMQYPLFYSFFPELKQNKQSSYIRWLWSVHSPASKVVS